MAIPSGSGTEVLCRGTIETLSNSQTAHVWTSPYRATTGTDTAVVPANTIITVLGFIATNTASGTENLRCYLHDGTGTLEILYQDIPEASVFAWNDRFVLYPGDKWSFKMDTSADVDIVTTFIKQDWSS
tara:strand:+ start:756 stop:1142 length:387 start_codon:yes stop_codon:yes gene_type:complete